MKNFRKAYDGKMKYQLCFTVGDEKHNKIIIEKLLELKDHLDKTNGVQRYTVHSCHLPKTIVEEKGFDTTICDALTNIFGDSYVNEVKATTFKEAIKHMDDYRRETASKVNKMIIIDEKRSNVALEVFYFSKEKIWMI